MIFMLNVFSASFPPILSAFLPGHTVQSLDLKQNKNTPKKLSPSNTDYGHVNNI